MDAGGDLTYTTDEKLKGFLDTNQLHREQLCLAVLSLDKRFTDVRPRHPRGGRDGGRDIEAMFRGTELSTRPANGRCASIFRPSAWGTLESDGRVDRPRNAAQSRSG